MLVAVGTLLLALSLWAAYGYLVLEATDARTLYTAEKLDASQKEERARATQRLHALVRDSESERAVLEELARTDALTAAEAIEAAGKAAGTRTVVRGATASALGGVSKSPIAKDLRAVEMLVDSEGRLQSILNAIKLFEALPFLSSIRSIEMDQASGGNQSDLWRAVIRIRIITTSAVGI